MSKNVDLNVPGNGTHATKLARAKAWLGDRYLLAKPQERKTHRVSTATLRHRWAVFNGR